MTPAHPLAPDAGLKPCPHCNGAADFTNSENWTQVICGSCGCRSNEYPESQDAKVLAAISWNRRAPSTSAETEAAVEAEPLKWRKPTDHPQDNEGALWVAAGIGGRYSITNDDGILLWWPHDEFVWESCASVAEAKAKAEADWQERFVGLIRARSQGEQK